MSTVNVFLRSLNVRVDVAKERLSCVQCDTLLPTTFTTFKCNHKVCPVCDVGKCHKCNESEIIPSNAVVLDALSTVTRVATCGLKFTNIHLYTNHVKGCVTCISTAYVMMKDKLMKKLTEEKAHNATLRTKLRDTEISLKRKLNDAQEDCGKLKRVASHQIAVYEQLKDQHARLRSRRVVVHDDDN